MKPLPESADDIYALAQGPLTLNREKREAEADEADQSVRVARKGKRKSRDSVLIVYPTQESVFNGVSKTFKKKSFFLLAARLFARHIQAIK